MAERLSFKQHINRKLLCVLHGISFLFQDRCPMFCPVKHYLCVNSSKIQRHFFFNNPYLDIEDKVKRTEKVVWSHQANRLACGWMSRAVNPFTVCSTLMESGVRGSKKRTSPLTLVGNKSVSKSVQTTWTKTSCVNHKRQSESVPDADDVSVCLLL